MPAIPKKGSAREDLMQHLQSMRDADADWRSGRTFSLVFNPGPEAQAVLKDAYAMFFSENALNPSAFPSLQRLEQETVHMTADLLNGDSKVAGNMTSGGTESILMAIKTARDWARAERGIAEPEVLLPITAHPAFDKAGGYFGVKMVYVPVDDSYRVDVEAMKAAINDNTIMLVGSAVQYAQGVVDPIAEIGALAKEHKLLCHVDACIGGFMLPWVERLGNKVPVWDFRVPGVTSISCDLHKYAYAAKGASVILYRSKELRKHQFHVYTDWPGGIYASPTMAGTRPGGAMAAAWAILNFLGQEGYTEMAGRVMQSSQKIFDGIREMEGLQILGEPHMSIAAFTHESENIYAIGDELQARGWHLDRQQNPNCLHLTVSQGHFGVEDEFLADLKESVEAVQAMSLRKMSDNAKVKIATGLASAMPDRWFGKISRASNKLGGGGVPKRSAAMYGMMAALPARGELKALVVDALDQLNSLPKGSAKK